MHQISVNGGEAYIQVEKTSVGEYAVMGDSLTTKVGDTLRNDLALEFSEWDGDVTDLDNGQSDESQCFGLSAKLQWGEVIFSPETIKANNLKSIEDRGKHL